MNIVIIIIIIIIIINKIIIYDAFIPAADHYHHKPETGIAVNICLGRDFTGANLLLTDDSGTRLSIPQIAGATFYLFHIYS